jgi:sugar lactone lactonase YvrE
MPGNSVLRKSQLVARGQMEGAEALAFHGDKVYAGLSDGRIVVLDTEYDQVDSLRFTGDPQRALPFPCGEYGTEPVCGRPLGLAFNDKGALLIADAYFGLLSMNATTARTTSLSRRSSDGKRQAFKFLNGLAVSPKAKGAIYMTDSSLVNQRRDYALEVVSQNPTGRLLRYSPKTKKTETLLDKLHFPNGVVISENEDFLLVAELTRARILKYCTPTTRHTPTRPPTHPISFHASRSIPCAHAPRSYRYDLKQKRASGKPGKYTVWADNLPILPDNLSWDEDEDGQKNGALWVGGQKRTATYDSLGGYGWLRTLMVKVMKPASMFDWVGEDGYTLRLSAEGKILDAPQDESGRIHR